MTRPGLLLKLKAVSFTAALDRFFYSPDEDAGDWGADFTVADEGAAAPIEGVEIPHQYLAVQLENEIYAVPINAVREIVKVPVLTEVPRAEKHLLGVMNLRGEVLPVFDVRAKLSLSPGAPNGIAALPRAARVVLVHAAEGDAGILVDRVLEVVKLLPSKFEPAPPGATTSGLTRKGETLYIFVEVDQVLG